MTTRIAVYTFRVMGPDDATDEMTDEILDELSHHVNVVESDFSDKLPEGYYCKFDSVGEPLRA